MTETVSDVSQSSPEEFLKGIRNKPKVSRNDFLAYLDEAIRISFEKVNLRNTNNSERQGWIRCITSAVAAGVPLVRDVEMDALRADVDELKKHILK
jgi:hypothetical protein